MACSDGLARIPGTAIFTKGMYFTVFEAFFKGCELLICLNSNQGSSSVLFIRTDIPVVHYKKSMRARAPSLTRRRNHCQIATPPPNAYTRNARHRLYHAGPFDLSNV